MQYAERAEAYQSTARSRIFLVLFLIYTVCKTRIIIDSVY